MTIPLTTAPTHLHPNEHWLDTERSHAESAVAAMILESLGAALDLDAPAKAERCMALGERITSYLVGILRPEWQSIPSKAYAPHYDDEKLPPARRWEIAAQLLSLLTPGFAELRSEGSASGEVVWAALLTDCVLNEIGQDLLDSPVVYAADIARAVDRVSAYLRVAIATRCEQSEEVLSRASSDILYLIVRDSCPYYLASGPNIGEMGTTIPGQAVSGEQEN